MNDQVSHTSIYGSLLTMQQGSAPFFFDIPLPDRWEQFRPIILDLYLQHNIPLPQIVTIMRDQYRFHAV